MIALFFLEIQDVPNYYLSLMDDSGEFTLDLCFIFKLVPAYKLFYQQYSTPRLPSFLFSSSFVQLNCVINAQNFLCDAVDFEQSSTARLTDSDNCWQTDSSRCSCACGRRGACEFCIIITHLHTTPKIKKKKTKPRDHPVLIWPSKEMALNTPMILGSVNLSSKNQHVFCK